MPGPARAGCPGRVGADAYPRTVTDTLTGVEPGADLDPTAATSSTAEEAVGTDVEPAAEPSVPGLSPSRAKDFLQCALLYRLRVVDRLAEPPSPVAARGTLVHAVLEHLFDLPPGERTAAAAHGLLPGQWAQLAQRAPDLVEIIGGPQEQAAWLASARDLLDTYFTLEDPARLAPRARELNVRYDLPGGPRLRGIIDRVDVAPNGWVRIVDYKTGRSPRAGYEGDALFQMRFYAYVVWRTRGVLPRMLQLTYLGDGTVLRHEPTEAEMATLEARVTSIWHSIQDSARAGSWTPRRTALCSWCSFQAHCPLFGGTPPPLDPAAVERATGVRPDEVAVS